MEQGHWDLGTRAEENTMEIDLHGEIAPPRSHLLKERLIAPSAVSDSGIEKDF
jgi:hypothetical protein